MVDLQSTITLIFSISLLLVNFCVALSPYGAAISANNNKNNNNNNNNNNIGDAGGDAGGEAGGGDNDNDDDDDDNVELKKANYELWLNYRPLLPSKNAVVLHQTVTEIECHNETSPEFSALANACEELSKALSILSDSSVALVKPRVNASLSEINRPSSCLVVRLSALNGTSEAETKVFGTNSMKEEEVAKLYRVSSSSTKYLELSAPTGRGILFGAFKIISALQTSDLSPFLPDEKLPFVSEPSAPVRMINMWDNLRGPTEYQSNCNDFERIPPSILHWDLLPSPVERYFQFGRLLASIGINAVVLNNINACDSENVMLLSTTYLKKAAGISKILSSLGIASLLSPCFGSPMIVGGLSTADPLNIEVQKWWKTKSEEAANIIPGFRGYLIKADSEHEPGPSMWNRSIPDAANMLGQALPDHSMCIWRSFMHPGEWNSTKYVDQAAFIYDTFVPLDGSFDDNVVLQTKAGPFDFQTNEPVQALFAAMPNTNFIVEMEITQTFTGQAIHACYLPSQYSNYLRFDTYRDGPDSYLYKVVVVVVVVYVYEYVVVYVE